MMDIDEIHPNTPKCIFNALLCDPVLYDDVFLHCTPGSIYKIGRTCWSGRYAAQEYVRRKFNINRHLSRFFPDPLAFRSVQASTGAVISGSTALQFLDRTVYSNSDLDLYVTAEQAFDLCEFVMSEQGGGYVFKRYPHQPQTFMDAWERVRTWKPAGGVDSDPFDAAWTNYGSKWIRTVFDFWSTTVASGEKQNIQVIVTTFDPLSAILAFHSTVVMNAITADTAICLFPEATFEEHVNLFLIRSELDNGHPALKKYEERGWVLVNEVTPEDVHKGRSVFRHGKRWVQDAHTWRLPLDTRGLQMQFGAPLEPSSSSKMNADIVVPPEFDPMRLGGFNTAYYEEDRLSQVIFGTVNSKIFTSRFIANKETVEKIGIFERAVIRLAEKSLGKLALSPRQCEEIFKRWNDACINKCGCSLRENEDPIPQLEKCEAFNDMVEFFPEIKAVLEATEDSEPEEPVYF